MEVSFADLHQICLHVPFQVGENVLGFCQRQHRFHRIAQRYKIFRCLLRCQVSVTGGNFVHAREQSLFLTLVKGGQIAFFQNEQGTGQDLALGFLFLKFF